MIIRLFHWAFRMKRIPMWDEHGNYTSELRPPTLGEAITGLF